MRRLGFVLVIAMLLAPLMASVAVASPQPTPVCRFCGGQFEAAAGDAGVNVTVGRSEVDVTVRADGTARWAIDLELTTGSAALAESPERLTTIARSLADEGYGLPDQPTFQNATLEGDRVQLVYRANEAVDREAGLIVVDWLHDGGREPWYHVNAERFTIHGPPGSEVANTPESGRVDGRAVTWTGESGESWAGGTDLRGSPYIVYAPEDGVANSLRAAVATALATLPIVAGAVKRYVLAQLVLFGIALGAVVLAVQRWRPQPGRQGLGVALGLLGGLGLVVPAITNGPEWIAGPPLLALGLAGIAAVPALATRLREPRAQAVAVTALLVLSYLLLWDLHHRLGVGWGRAASIALEATAIGFPLAAMVPLGGALARDDEGLHGWLALCLVAFAAVSQSVINVVDPPVGLGAGLFFLALLGLAGIAPLVGSLGLLLGRSLADVDRETAGPGVSR